jgi:hypothetical protein
MYHLYHFKREEFLPHYHKRSNVESTFMAIKSKFGDGVRSRNDVAQINEAPHLPTPVWPTAIGSNISSVNRKGNNSAPKPSGLPQKFTLGKGF